MLLFRIERVEIKDFKLSNQLKLQIRLCLQLVGLALHVVHLVNSFFICIGE